MARHAPLRAAPSSLLGACRRAAAGPGGGLTYVRAFYFMEASPGMRAAGRWAGKKGPRRVRRRPGEVEARPDLPGLSSCPAPTRCRSTRIPVRQEPRHKNGVCELPQLLFLPPGKARVSWAGSHVGCALGTAASSTLSGVLWGACYLSLQRFYFYFF